MITTDSTHRIVIYAKDAMNVTGKEKERLTVFSRAAVPNTTFHPKPLSPLIILPKKSC
jgi:hypothetical protein